MKRVVILSVLILAMLVCFCACGKKSSQESSIIDSISNAVDNAASAQGSGSSTAVITTGGQDSYVAVTPVPATGVIPTPVPTATQAPFVTPIPTVYLTPAPTPTPTPYVAPTPTYVTVTKSPTGETVEQGGRAVFIAYANNATSTNWILVSPDSKTSYRADEATAYFTGLKVSGQGTTTLALSNVPESLDGWRVQCYFTGNGGPVYTNGAYITVTVSQDSLEEAKELAKDCREYLLDYANRYSVDGWVTTKITDFTYEDGVGKCTVKLYWGDSDDLSEKAYRAEVVILTFPAYEAYYPIELGFYDNTRTHGVLEYWTYTNSTSYNKTNDKNGAYWALFKTNMTDTIADYLNDYSGYYYGFDIDTGEDDGDDF